MDGCIDGMSCENIFADTKNIPKLDIDIDFDDAVNIMPLLANRTLHSHFHLVFTICDDQETIFRCVVVITANASFCEMKNFSKKKKKINLFHRNITI